MSKLEEKILRRIPLEILAFSLVLAIGAVFLFKLRVGIFILAGGVLSAAGFFWLKQSLGRFLYQDRGKALKSGIAFYLLRLVLIIAVFFIIILLFPGMVLAFAAGFSTVILVFLVEAIMALAQMRQWKS